MRKFFKRPAGLLSVLHGVLLLVLLAAPACSKKSASSEPLPPERVATAIKDGFKNGSTDNRGVADEAAADWRNNNTPAAFQKFQALATRPDLTPEQRALAAQASLTAARKLQEQAAKGDATAAQALRVYRSTR